MKKVFRFILTTFSLIALFSCSDMLDQFDEIGGNSSGAQVPGDFVSVWDTSLGSADSTIALPLEASGTYNFVVDWGDGTSEEVTSFGDADKSHLYSSNGIYEVTISGVIDGFRFNDAGDCLKIIEISNWGILKLGNSGYYFYGCENLQISATDILDCSEIINMRAAFNNCTALTIIPSMNNWDVSNVQDMGFMFRNSHFNQNIGNWDVGSVTTMNSMFYGASSFNQNIGNWDVSNVEYMANMFDGASSFNQYIGGWDVSNVENMANMFDGASSFNQNIGGWNVSNVLWMRYMFNNATSFNGNINGWDVSNVEQMHYMFYSASSFNQYIGSWDVSNVRSMDYMFYDADSFNQDIGSWNVRFVRNISYMFFGASLFNQNLNGWSFISAPTRNNAFERSPLDGNEPAWY